MSRLEDEVSAVHELVHDILDAAETGEFELPNPLIVAVPYDCAIAEFGVTAICGAYIQVDPASELAHVFDEVEQKV